MGQSNAFSQAAYTLCCEGKQLSPDTLIGKFPFFLYFSAIPISCTFLHFAYFQSKFRILFKSYPLKMVFHPLS